MGVWEGIWLALQDRDEQRRIKEDREFERQKFAEEMALRKAALYADLSKSIGEDRKEAAKIAGTIRSGMALGLSEPVAVALYRSGQLDIVNEALTKKFEAGELNPSAVQSISRGVQEYLGDLTTEELASFTLQGVLTEGNLTTEQGQLAALSRAVSSGDVSALDSVLEQVSGVREVSPFDLSTLNVKAVDPAEYGRIRSQVTQSIAPLYSEAVTTQTSPDGSVTYMLNPDDPESPKVARLIDAATQKVVNDLQESPVSYDEALGGVTKFIYDMSERGVKVSELTAGLPTLTLPEAPFLPDVPEVAPPPPMPTDSQENVMEFLGDNPTPVYDPLEELRKQGYR